MVSFKQPHDGYFPSARNFGPGQFKYNLLPLKGIRKPLYLLGSPANESDFSQGFPIAGGQSFLNALLLAQWEDIAWHGKLEYDVTSCETKVVSGSKKFVVQLNEKWDSEFHASFCPRRMEFHGRDILFYAARAESGVSEFISSAQIPRDGTLIIPIVNPIEYGHVVLVPYEFYSHMDVLDRRSLENTVRIAMEMNDFSFRVSYDCAPSTDPCAAYFQAHFMATTLAVELRPVIPVFDIEAGRGIGLHVGEVSDYPIKTIVFMSKENTKELVELVMEICSVLRERSGAFSLVISDCGRKIFLFLQVLHDTAATTRLSAWECGGFFVLNRASEFDCAAEGKISETMASVSLCEEGFRALKRLVCAVAGRLFAPGLITECVYSPA